MSNATQGPFLSGVTHFVTISQSKIYAEMMRGAGTTIAKPLDFLDASISATLGKTVRHLFNTDGVVEGGVQGAHSVRETLQKIDIPALLVVFTTPTGSKGLLVLSALLINALVEVMTGAPDHSVYREKRTPTLIDTALCRNFCQQILAQLPQEMAKQIGANVLPKLTWDRSETQPDRLIYVLGASSLIAYSGQVQFQKGTRGGEISLFLPGDIWLPDRPKTVPPDANWAASLNANVGAAPIKMRADLETLEIPLAQALSLKPGDMLPISQASLSGLILTLPSGEKMLRGRLGQVNGKKAISISAGVAGPNGPLVDIVENPQTPAENETLFPPTGHNEPTVTPEHIQDAKTAREITPNVA